MGDHLLEEGQNRACVFLFDDCLTDFSDRYLPSLLCEHEEDLSHDTTHDYFLLVHKVFQPELPKHAKNLLELSFGILLCVDFFEL